MLTLETAMGPVDISADRLEEWKRFPQFHIVSSDSEDTVLDRVKGQFEVQMEALAYAIQARGYPAPEHMRRLEAHRSKCQTYSYRELRDGRWHSHYVNDWIAAHENVNDALFVHVCNTPPTPIPPRERCFVAHPKHLSPSTRNDDIVLFALDLADRIEIVPPRSYTVPSGVAQPKEFRCIALLYSLREEISRIYDKPEARD